MRDLRCWAILLKLTQRLFRLRLRLRFRGGLAVLESALLTIVLDRIAVVFETYTGHVLPFIGLITLDHHTTALFCIVPADTANPFRLLPSWCAFLWRRILGLRYHNHV
jgi:hypothetical protein